VFHPSPPTLAEHYPAPIGHFLQRRYHDPQHCYELFVRAFRHRDSVAFDRLLEVYNGLVIHWAKRHSLYDALQDERDKITHYAFIKMWRSTRGDRFTFDSLPAILGYLRDCVDAALSEMYRDFQAKPRAVAARPPEWGTTPEPGETLDVASDF
jgi:hypothetical protein